MPRIFGAEISENHIMYLNNTSMLARRAFLRRAGHLGLAGIATPWALNLAAMGEAAAFSATDYKAIVCVFLYGGNDYGNTIVPFDNTNYAKYAAIRTGIATPQADLALTALSPTTALPGGMQLALAPQMGRLKNLFDLGKLGVQLNVGPLVQPTTLAQYNAKSVPLPAKLFSHNDQQSVWQSSQAEGAVQGWGGRMGDLGLANNGNATFTCISVTGNAVYLAGQSAVPYQVSPSGAVPINGLKSVYGSATCGAALNTLITQSSTHVMENEYAKTTKRSMDSEVAVTAATAGVTLATPFNATNPLGSTNPLAAQLQMVAKLIAGRSALSAKRQVFMVSLGGFDNHDFLPTQHPILLSSVSDALASFYDATVELGVANSVTAFTASDFGRTLASNGDGSDHGWGSHHFVLGGAVQGQKFYGTAPAIAVNGPDDVGQGRLLPTTSVDQFAATLASWFGVSATELPLVVPNINNYTLKNLGFV
jgi:uncharacterized protein (DUF1501 family)